jgi:hypothetical protein
LEATRRADPGRPLLTTYDDLTGERVGRSLATFDNWVCKLANLFGAEWGLDAGDVVAIRVEKTWQRVASVVAAWTAGLTIMLDPTPDASPVGVVPIGPWDDFARDVPGQPDVLIQSATITGTDAALIDSTGTSTHAALVARGLAAAGAVGLTPGGRLATDAPGDDPGWLDLVALAPLATGSSLVHVVGASAERRVRIAEQERATCTSWGEAGF